MEAPKEGPCIATPSLLSSPKERDNQRRGFLLLKKNKKGEGLATLRVERGLICVDCTLSTFYL
jgi:hypothetical protein